MVRRSPSWISFLFFMDSPQRFRQVSRHFLAVLGAWHNGRGNPYASPGRKDRRSSHRTGGVSLQGQPGRHHLRGQGQVAAPPGQKLFPGFPPLRHQAGPAALGDRGSRVHRRRQRDGGPGSREQPDQATQAQVQHPPQGRQDLPLHQADRQRALSTHPGDPPRQERRGPLFRSLLSRQSGLPNLQVDESSFPDPYLLH